MANVIVKAFIKYRVTQKNAAGKEISQKFVKAETPNMVMTEAQFAVIHAHTDEIVSVAGFGEF